MRGQIASYDPSAIKLFLTIVSFSAAVGVRSHDSEKVSWITLNRTRFPVARC